MKAVVRFEIACFVDRSKQDFDKSKGTAQLGHVFSNWPRKGGKVTTGIGERIEKVCPWKKKKKGTWGR